MGKGIKSQNIPYTQSNNVPGRNVELYAENYNALRVFREAVAVEAIKDIVKTLEQKAFATMIPTAVT